MSHQKSRLRNTGVRIALAAAAVTLGVTPAALAGTVTYQNSGTFSFDDNVQYTDGAGQTNNVTATETGGATSDVIRIADPAGITLGTGASGNCTLSSGNTVVSCDSGGGDYLEDVTFNLGGGTDTLNINSAEWDDIFVNGEAGNDTLNVNTTTDADSITINGGADNDTIRAGNQAATLNGGGGADNLFGGSAADLLYGSDSTGAAEAGATSATYDVMRGGAGADRFDCNAGGTAAVADTGIDRVRYDDDPSAPSGINVSINNVADDAGQTDSVCTTVESVTGTNGNDTLTGSTSANTLAGLNGTDSFVADNGNDFMGGGLGGDTFDGGAGTDTVTYTETGAGYPTINGIEVRLDNVANDGVKTATGVAADAFSGATEGDNVQNTVETIRGSNGPDRIDTRAVNTPVSIFGNAGDDFLLSGDAADALDGGPGADDFTCGAGVDILTTDASDTLAADCP